MPWCEKCNKFMWSGESAHRCPPVYECWDDGCLPGDDPLETYKPAKVYARDHESAAIKYAESHGGEFGGITPDNEINAWVRKEGETKKFKMTAEYSIDVYAEEIE